jgi:hypothetical protein
VENSHQFSGRCKFLSLVDHLFLRGAGGGDERARSGSEKRRLKKEKVEEEK